MWVSKRTPRVTRQKLPSKFCFFFARRRCRQVICWLARNESIYRIEIVTRTGIWFNGRIEFNGFVDQMHLSQEWASVGELQCWINAVVALCCEVLSGRKTPTKVDFSVTLILRGSQLRLRLNLMHNAVIKRFVFTLNCSGWRPSLLAEQFGFQKIRRIIWSTSSGP